MSWVQTLVIYSFVINDALTQWSMHVFLPSGFGEVNLKFIVSDSGETT